MKLCHEVMVFVFRITSIICRIFKPTYSRMLNKTILYADTGCNFIPVFKISCHAFNTTNRLHDETPDGIFYFLNHIKCGGTSVAITGVAITGVSEISRPWVADTKWEKWSVYCLNCLQHATESVKKKSGDFIHKNYFLCFEANTFDFFIVPHMKLVFTYIYGF